MRDCSLNVQSRIFDSSRACLGGSLPFARAVILAALIKLGRRTLHIGGKRTEPERDSEADIRKLAES